MTSRTDVRTPTSLWLRLAGAALAWVALYQLNERLWTWLFRDLAGLDLARKAPRHVHSAESGDVHDGRPLASLVPRPLELMRRYGTTPEEVLAQ